MKEKEFKDTLNELNLVNLIIPVYWGVDEKGNAVIDFDSIKEEFENKLKEVGNIINI